MSALSFLDSNILVYTDDSRYPEKKTRAVALYAELRRKRRGALSTQVLQEYFNSATAKLAVPADLARRKVQLFARSLLVQVDLALILRAIDFRRLHPMSFWDALIVAAALHANCKVLYSEDLQHSRKYDSLLVVNPFAD